MHIPKGIQLYRLKAGYSSKRSAVEALQKKGLMIKFSRYDNIEQGRTKRVTPIEAKIICDTFKMPANFFLKLNTQKLRVKKVNDGV